MLKLQGGIKMSSRRGNVVTALEILQAATDASRESGIDASHDTVLAAVKYALTKNKVGGDISYDPRESIALEGNSGPYLQYAHARACSILKKAEMAGVVAAQPSELTPDERVFVRQMSQYSSVIDRAIAELAPHYICTYIYELSQSFNRFYEHNRVIGDDRQSERLQMVKWHVAILADGLGLLGITAPEHM
jgi:arginyl-tRNA synthetase